MPLNVCLVLEWAVRVFLIFLTILLTLAAVALAALSLGSLASLNASVPPLLSAVSAAEGLLSARMLARLHLSLDAFWRALAWAGLCCLSVWLAAYLKPRPR
jgi:hypothetical protein